MLQKKLVRNEINLLHSNFRSCLKKMVKISGSSPNVMHTKIYMHDVRTCEKCQPTYKHRQNIYAHSTKEG